MPRRNRADVCNPALVTSSASFTLKPMSAALALAFLSLNAATTDRVFAAPSGGQVSAGAATIQHPNAQTVIVNQTTARAALNWNSFSIGSGESVIFRQPSASAVALNRVTGSEASLIHGTLQANGNVFLVNPSGVLFGRGASVDVGGLVASTLSISNQDFMAGRYAFSGGAGAGRVVNEGTIRAADGGYVALIGNQVSNTGTIVANAGSVALGAGDTMLLDFGGDGLLNLKVNTAAAGARIDHGGVIQADGGQVWLSARAKTALSSTAMNVDGIITARGLAERNGRIVLDGGSNGITQVSGTLDASSSAAGHKGGEIRVLGEYVGLLGNAKLDASGMAGGGTVLVGGDYQGKNAEVPNAFRTYVAPGAWIKADATVNGDGGTIIVWADDTTRFVGSVSARGGAEGGNGGFVEVSGKGNLLFAGSADLSAPAGRLGKLLLDPRDITVQAVGDAAGNAAVADNMVFFSEPSNTTDVTITASVLQTNLQTSDVVMQANRDIAIDAAIAPASGTGALTLQAGRRIAINQDITLRGAFTATANDVGADAGARGGGSAQFTMAAGRTISTATNNNNINIAISTGPGGGRASGNITLANLSAGTGHVLVKNDGTSAGSSIVRADAAQSIGAASAALDVSTASGGSVGTEAAPINVTVTNIGARAQGGGAFIRSTGGVNVGGATLGALTGLATANGGSIGLATTNGSITTSEPIAADGAGSVTITAGGAGSTATLSNAIASGSGAVVITATDVSLLGTISNGAGDVTLQPSTPAATIGVNDATANFNVSAAELGQITTTGLVTIGAASNIGGVTVGVDGVVNAGGTNLELVTGGTLTSAAGGITTSGNLTFSANNMVLGGAAIQGASVTLRPTTIGQSIDLGGADGGGTLGLTSAEIDTVTATGGTLTLGRNDGSPAGNIAISNAIAPSGATTLVLRTGGGISQTAPITETNLAVLAGAAVTLTDAANNIGNLAASLAGGGAAGSLSYTDADAFAVDTVAALPGVATLGGAGATVALSAGAAGTLSINAPISAAGALVSLTGHAIVSNGGTGTVIADQLSTSSAGATTLGAPGNNVATFAAKAINAGSTITYTDSDTFAVGNVAALTGVATNNGIVVLQAGASGAGNMTLAQALDAGTAEIRLSASNGGITQTGGTITAGQLSVLARDSSALAQAGNNIGLLSASISGPAQSFSYRDADGFTAGLTGLFLLNAATHSVQTNDGDVTLTSDSGTLTLANPIAAGVGAVTLNSTLGNIVQSAGAGIAAATLNGVAGTTAELSGNNAVSNLGTFTTNGAFTLADAGGLNVTGPVSTTNNGLASITTSGTLAVTTGSVAGGGVALQATGAGSDVTLNGAVNGNAGTVTLNAADLISQAATGLINTTGTLTGTAGTSAVLDQANTIGSLGVFTTGGAFTLGDSTGGLTVTGSVNAGAGAATVTTAGGALALQSNDVSAIGGIALQGEGVTSTGGTLSTIAAANSGTPSGNIQVTATGNGAIALAGTLTASGADSDAGAASAAGNVTLTTPNGPIAVAAVGARGGDGTAGNTSGGDGGTIAYNVGGGFGLTLNGDQVTRGGNASGGANAGIGRSIVIAAPVSLGTDALIDARRGTGAGAATAGNVTFAGTLQSPVARNLTVMTSGATTFGAIVGGSGSPLASITTDAGGTTAINGGAVTTTGAQTYNDALTLGADATLVSTAAGNIVLSATVQSAGAPRAIVVNTAGTTSFAGVVGGGAGTLGSLTTDAAGSTALAGGAITTTGAQVYGDAVTLGAATAVTSNGGGAITFGNTVDGAFGLTANTGGTTTFAAPVGAITPLASLATDASGSTAISAGTIATSGTQNYGDRVTIGANATLTSSAGNVSFANAINADAAANNRALTVNAPAGSVIFSGNIGDTQPLADLDVTASANTIFFNAAAAQTVNVSGQGGNTVTFNAPVVLAQNLTITTDGAGGADNSVTFAGSVNADSAANNRTLVVGSGVGTATFGAVGNTQELGALSVAADQVVLSGNASVSGGVVNLANAANVTFAPGVTIDTDRAGGMAAAGNVLFGAATKLNSAADANLTIDTSADGGAGSGLVELGTVGDANRLNVFSVVGDRVVFRGNVNAQQVIVTANAVETPTGRIVAARGFSGTSESSAAITLRGLSGPGSFGTRDAPVQIDAPGLFVVIPNTPNSLPFVFLAGDANRRPVYEFAGDPTHRFVFYNGAAPDSAADRAAQGAVVQQLRALFDELTLAGFAKENIRKQLLQGSVLETGLARPGIDEFTGDGVTPPASCDAEQTNADSSTLTCQ